jgi:four helix bundle protein
MDNIAVPINRDERSSRLEFINFLGYSKGSAGEVRSQLYRAKDQQYVKEEIFELLNTEYETLGGKIGGFMNYLNQSEHKGQKFKDRK